MMLTKLFFEKQLAAKEKEMAQLQIDIEWIKRKLEEAATVENPKKLFNWKG